MHRGPAAVGILCETTEGWTPEKAEEWLKAAGTSADYPGLYRSVREYRPPGASSSAKASPLPEVAETEPLVDTMVAIDELFDRLKAGEKEGWKAVATAAGDRAPVHDATLLSEHFRELARTDETANRIEDYRAKLAAAERAAEALRSALRAMPPDPAVARAALKDSAQQCSACHKAFRNPARK
jgi:cytochrome c556